MPSKMSEVFTRPPTCRDCGLNADADRTRTVCGLPVSLATDRRLRGNFADSARTQKH